MLPAATPNHARAVQLAMGGRFLGKPAFSHSGLAGEREQAAATDNCAVDFSADFVELPALADEGVSAANGVEVAHFALGPGLNDERPHLDKF